MEIQNHQAQSHQLFRKFCADKDLFRGHSDAQYHFGSSDHAHYLDIHSLHQPRKPGQNDAGELIWGTCCVVRILFIFFPFLRYL